MKKTVSLIIAILLCFVSGFYAFASSVQMTEYKHKGLHINIPSSMIQDTEWAEKNGYADAWYDKDMNYEIILYETPYDEYEMPLLLNFYPEKDRNICRKYSSEYVFGVSVSSHGLEYTQIDGKNIKYYEMEIEKGTKRQVDHFQFMFTEGNRTYHLMFFIYNKEYRYTAREIANSVTTSLCVQDFFVGYEYWARILGLASVLFIIGYFRKKREHKRKYGA